MSYVTADGLRKILDAVEYEYYTQDLIFLNYMSGDFDAPAQGANLDEYRVECIFWVPK